MYYDTGFTLAPRGDLDRRSRIDSVASQALGTFQTYLAVRPQKNLTGDGSYFFQGMGGSHELKFGFSYRDMKTHSATLCSGNQLAGYIHSATNVVARVVRAPTSTTAASTWTSTPATCSRRTASPSTSASASTTSGEQPGELGARQRDVPRPAAGRGLPGQRRKPAGLEQLHAARGPELRARRVAPDDRARLLLPLLPAARVWQRDASRTRRAPATSPTAGTTRTATVSCSRARSTSARCATPRPSTSTTRARSPPTPSTRSTATASRARTRVHRRARPRARRKLRGRNRVHLPQGQRLEHDRTTGYRLAGACSDPPTRRRPAAR